MATGCYSRSAAHKQKVSDWSKGNKYCEGRILSPETRKKISQALKGRPKPSIRGMRNHSWKGGVTEINQKIRTSAPYKEWRKKVFERDNWTCVWCRAKGVRLNADHIKPFADFPELRFEIDNGRTLCIPCHLSTETFGWKLYNKKHANIQNMATCTPCNGSGIVGNGPEPWLHIGQTSVCKDCKGTGVASEAPSHQEAPAGFVAESVHVAKAAGKIALELLN